MPFVAIASTRDLIDERARAKLADGGKLEAWLATFDWIEGQSPAHFVPGVTVTRERSINLLARCRESPGQVRRDHFANASEVRHRSSLRTARDDCSLSNERV